MSPMVFIDIGIQNICNPLLNNNLQLTPSKKLPEEASVGIVCRVIDTYTPLNVIEINKTSIVRSKESKERGKHHAASARSGEYGGWSITVTLR